MDMDEAITQLSVDISVVLKDKQLEAVKRFPYFPLNNLAAKVAFSDLQASLEAFAGAFFLPLEEDNTETRHTQQD